MTPLDTLGRRKGGNPRGRGDIATAPRRKDGRFVASMTSTERHFYKILRQEHPGWSHAEAKEAAQYLANDEEVLAALHELRQFLLAWYLGALQAIREALTH
jgi:hypothetical protein